MNYRGIYRKYIAGSSNYETYVYGDVVEKDGSSYICGVSKTFGYLPEDPVSGFRIMQRIIVNFTEGITAPASPIKGDRWFNTADGVLYTSVTDDSGTIWVKL